YHFCGLHPTLAGRLGQTINGQQLRQLLEFFLTNCASDSPPLVQFMAHFPLTIHGPVGVLALTSATLGDALDGALQYAPLVMPAFAIRRRDRGPTCHLLFERLHDFGPANALLTESVVATFLKTAPFLCRAPHAVQVHYQHGPQGDPAAYEAALGAAFFFNRRVNQIVLQTRDLDIPLLAPSRSSRLLMQATLEQQRLLGRNSRPTTEQLRHLLQEALQQGKPLDAAQLAAALRMSPRTLSRRLKAEGTTLPQLQAEIGLTHAERLLLDTGKTVAEIAQCAGFGDATSFSRAFKRFSGEAPALFRRRSRAPGLPDTDS
ncbi:MAG: AraC family transcriptional regulator ligand-binding domain-containing protein, partial [Moraxellaceae bacterium]|nr:AraC family transcriptional regulator ligand-binding domain-containing protein [Moraxellaceae bacterium]